MTVLIEKAICPVCGLFVKVKVDGQPFRHDGNELDESRMMYLPCPAGQVQPSDVQTVPVTQRGDIQPKYGFGECGICGKVAAKRVDGTIRIHRSLIDGKACSQSPTTTVKRKNSRFVSPRQREAIAQEIRDMVDGLTAARYVEWLEVADFVERSGMWRDWIDEPLDNGAA